MFIGFFINVIFVWGTVLIVESWPESLSEMGDYANRMNELIN